ncbi:hypothetical protein T492DRAFT_842804 [Pavlovales sp. CCMP2436]|nr:hypothetical protein T492DRAFT_842804 [Pavlovales sp. CCMP2436]
MQAAEAQATDPLSLDAIDSECALLEAMPLVFAEPNVPPAFARSLSALATNAIAGARGPLGAARALALFARPAQAAVRAGGEAEEEDVVSGHLGVWPTIAHWVHLHFFWDSAGAQGPAGHSLTPHARRILARAWTAATGVDAHLSRAGALGLARASLEACSQAPLAEALLRRTDIVRAAAALLLTDADRRAGAVELLIAGRHVGGAPSVARSSAGKPAADARVRRALRQALASAEDKPESLAEASRLLACESAVSLLGILVALVPATAAPALWSCLATAESERGAPVALVPSLAPLLAHNAPPSLRSAACRLLTALACAAEPAAMAAVLDSGLDEGGVHEREEGGSTGGGAAIAHAILSSLAAEEAGSAHASDWGGAHAPDEPAAAVELRAALRSVLSVSASAKAAALAAGIVPRTLRRCEDAAALLASTLARAPVVRPSGALPTKPLQPLSSLRTRQVALGGPAGPQGALAPARALSVIAVRGLERVLCSEFALLRATLLGSPGAKEEAARHHLPAFIARAWPLLSSTETLACEALGTLCNLVAHSDEAKLSLLNEGGRAGAGSRASLVASICAMAVDGSAAPSVRALCWAIARSLASHADGRAALQRLSFAQAAVRALHSALRAEADDAALTGSLECLANWTFAPDGVASLLRTPSTIVASLEDILEGATHSNGRSLLLTRLLAGPSGKAARRHEVAAVAALVLRNIAQHPEGRAHVLSSERALPVLLAALSAPDPTARLAANASAALWGLLHKSAKAKAVMKSGPLVQALADAEGALRALAGDAAVVGRGGPGSVRERERRPYLDEALRNLRVN